jgi:hypothetical protein
MKTLKTAALCVLFCAAFSTGFAQHDAPPITEPDYNKPKLFAMLPSSIDIAAESMQLLFGVPEGEPVSIALGGQFFKGVVVSHSDPADKNLRSVVIRSTNYTGAAFTFTEVISKDGGVSYKGRIISRSHSDAYELQLLNGRYQLVKKHQLSIVNE